MSGGEAATGRQLAYLRDLAPKAGVVSIPDGLTKGEASALIDQWQRVAGIEPRPRSRGRRRSGVTVFRTSSGWTGTRNVNGRCIDAPCCGCCTC